MGIFQVVVEDCKEMYWNHKEDMLNCIRQENVQGAQFHSGVMLGIAETVNKIFGDDELYLDWLNMFTKEESSL